MTRPEPGLGFEWVERRGHPALRCRDLDQFAEHLFTTRPWRLGSRDPDNGDEGWYEAAAGIAVDPRHLARLHQVHGAAVVVAVPGASAPWPQADIHLTADAAMALAVQTADCVPLLLADSRSGAVCAAHAGWRGLAARVPGVAVAALARQYGVKPSDLVAAIGPSIGACCYEVGADVCEAFRANGFADAEIARWFFDQPQPTVVNPSMPSLSSVRRANHWFFDGIASAREQLVRAGVPDDRIHTAGLCTASHPDLLCSYRRDGRAAGRMAAVIRRRVVERIG